MHCQLCLEDRALIDAHAIPAAFFQLGNLDDETPLIVKNKALGVYDPHILCESCERSFSPWDSEAAKVLIHGTGRFTEMEDNGVPLAYVLASYDYSLLKLFFLSVLWRAHWSVQPFYKVVDLGPRERALREAILAREPGEAGFFPVTLGRWYATPERRSLITGMVGPRRLRYGTANGYRFYLADYVAEIVVSGEVPAKMRELCLRPDAPLHIMRLPFDESPEHRAMRETVRASDTTMRQRTTVRQRPRRPK